MSEGTKCYPRIGIFVFADRPSLTYLPSGMTRLALLVVMGAGLVSGLLAGACSNDDGSAVTPGACDQIIDACHPKDDGSDEFINGCHSTAHEGTDADCSPNLQACLDACNAAPDVGTGGHESGTEESGHVHESSGATGHDSSGGSSGHDHGTTAGTTADPSTSGTTAADDSSQASCDELGTICHDAVDEFGMMCHEVGHAGDEAACAEIWVECLAHCNA